MQNLIGQLRALGRVQLIALTGVGVGLLGLMAFLVLRAGTPPMGLLYAELETRDAGAIVAALERQRVPYRRGAGGTQVLVPAQDGARLRLSLARDRVDLVRFSRCPRSELQLNGRSGIPGARLYRGIGHDQLIVFLARKTQAHVQTGSSARLVKKGLNGLCDPLGKPCPYSATDFLFLAR